MAAHRNVHLTKEIDHLVAGNAKFTRQIMYSKLAQPNSSPTLRTSRIGSRLSARIPLARPLSTIPITAAVSRPAALPSSDADGPATTVIPLAWSRGITLSKLLLEASGAAIARCTLPRFAASLTRSTPTIAPRPRTPRPIRPRSLRCATASNAITPTYRLRCPGLPRRLYSHHLRKPSRCSPRRRPQLWRRLPLQSPALRPW